MTLPILLRHDMVGAPQLTNAAGSLISVLTAALVNGFNTQSVVSATASGGVVTFNFATAPGFAALDTVQIAGSSVALANGVRRVQSAGSNQVLVAVPGIANGAVGGTMTLKFAPLGWTRPFTGTNLAAYRMGGGISQRFLRVADTVVGGNGLVRGYETMTAISTGTGLFPTTAQAAGNGVIWYKNTSLTAPWIVVGDEKRFYFVSNTNSEIFVAGGGFDHITFFGQPSNVIKPADAFNVIIGDSSFPAASYINRMHTGIGTALPVNFRGLGSLNQFGWSGTYPNPADAGVLFAQSGFAIDTDGSGALRGTLPGMLEPLASPSSEMCGSIMTGITGVVGRLLLLKNAYSYSSIGLLLDEDWV